MSKYIPIPERRDVHRVGKDRSGEITHLCSRVGGWGSVPYQTAITQIESGTYKYWAVSKTGHRAEILVRSRNGDKYLTTAPDKYTKNNLGKLPECEDC